MAHPATVKHQKPDHVPPAPAAETSLSAVAYAMRSHCGRVRHSNQDACAALAEKHAFVVCDGMGGAAAGEVASHLATESFLNSLCQASPETPPHKRMQQAVAAANQAVFQRSQKSRALRGMGTTLISVLVESNDVSSHPTAWLAHVGDSRAYLYRRSHLTQLTQDHSMVEEQIRAGLISREEASVSPVRNVITRAVGTQPTVETDIASHPMQQGDLLLLASDGLTRELSNRAISGILSRHTPSTLEVACDELVEAANERGGHDNITVLLVACT